MSIFDLFWIFLMISAMALYHQPAQKRPSVSYVPTPYRPPERRGTRP
jgi:hypothetical protein